MKSSFMTVFTALVVLTGCQDYNQEVNVPSRLEILVSDFKESQVYEDLRELGFELNPRKAQLVEFTQFEYLFLEVDEESAYLVKYLPGEGWRHFLRINSTFTNTELSALTGTVEFEFYTEGVRSVHTFSSGSQLEYLVFAEDSRRINTSAKTVELETCQSMCHALDCAGRKFDSMHWVNQVVCAYDIVPCMTVLVLTCLDDGCANSPVKSCNHH